MRLKPGPAAAHDIDERQLRKLRWRLTSIMLALLLVLLLLLGLTVYSTMQSQLLQPVRQSVKDRASSELSRFREFERSDTERTGASEPVDEQEVGGVGISFISSKLTVLAGSQDPFGKRVPDAQAASTALQTRSATYSTRRVGNEDYLVYTAPAYDKGRIVGVIQTASSEKQYREGLRTLLVVLASVGGLGLVASAFISGFVVRRALIPIRLSMRRQRDFVADAAHELRTPLAVIRTTAELGLSDESHADQRASLEQVMAQSNQLSRLVEDLSLLARADTGAGILDFDNVDLSELVAETVANLEVLADARHIALRSDLALEMMTVRGDAGRLRQLLVVLVDNALKHTPPRKEVSVELNHEHDRAVLRVRDQGPGIPERDLSNIFDRFYRSAAARSNEQGAGLGLAIGKWIAEAHGGRIQAANADEGGAIFTVSLPLVADSRKASSVPSPAPSA